MSKLLAALDAKSVQRQEDPSLNDSMYDIVFVMNSSARGWILERICKEIERHTDLHCGWYFSDFNHHFEAELPNSKRYFFAHYVIAAHALAKHSWLKRRECFVYFTHPDFTRGGVGPGELIAAFRHCNGIFCMNRSDKDFLVKLGVPDRKVDVAVGGVNLEMFGGSGSAREVFGFVGGYYERKNPQGIISVVRNNPDKRFVLLEGDHAEVTNSGIWWENSPYFDDLNSLDNLSIVQAKYEDYPKFYDKMFGYISLSHLEGGPISLLEALAAGVYPIVTDTGFARDVVSDGRYGRILSGTADASEVRQCLIDAEGCDREKLRERAGLFTWKAMAQGVQRRIVDGFENELLSPGIYEVKVGEVAASWLGTGWHGVETKGVWSKPNGAMIRIPKACPDVARVILALHTSVEADAVEIYISYNGLPFSSHFISRRRQEISIALEAGGIGGTTIELRSDFYFIPSRQNTNATDVRELGIRLTQIELAA